MTPAKIMIVEDDRVVARDIQQQLIRMGHSVVGTTARGEDALALALETKPTLALMDIRLEGEIDGIEAAALIRERCRIPVVFLTAYTDDQTVLRASQSEPFGYLIKPFEDSQLRTTIEMALYKHAAELKLRESERRFAVTLSSIGDAVIATDGNGRITFMNPAAAVLTGWTAAEATGQPLLRVYRVVNEKTGEPVEDPAAKVLRFGNVLGSGDHTLLVSRDGRQIPIDVSGAPICDDAGEITGVVWVFRDVSERRQAAQAEALREFRTRVEQALRGSDVAVWEFEMTDGTVETARVHTINHWEQHGYDANAAVSFDVVVERWHPDDRERVVRAIHAYLAGETDHYEIECRIRQQNGGYRTRIARGTVIRDASGVPLKFVGSSVDITDRIRAEEAMRLSEERYRNTFEHAPAGMVHTDFHERSVLRVNKTYCDMTGWSREELLGRGGMDIIHPEDRQVSSERLAAVARGEHAASYAAQLRIMRKDGSSMWIRITVSPGRDSPDGHPYAIGMIEDISERMRLESELKSAKESAEASNRAKDEFLANVSHEIRTPMNAILGMTELVLDTRLDEMQRQSLQTVKSATASLLAIINDLLDFSKIEAGKMELDLAEFQLRALLGDAMRALAVRAHRKGLELLCSVAPDVPDTLIGDAGRLRQVLINLVGNAVKFTMSGEIAVEVGVASQHDQDVELEFAVRDTGIGIPLDKQTSIFRAFEQEDMSTTRKYGGTGLGLTIAARLVAMMGGTIEVQSAPQRGSTFGFTAHFQWRDSAESSSVIQSQAALRDLRVLVVDDNAANREILGRWLTGWRMQPTLVSDGVAAMDALWHAVTSRQPYGLILLDARMPDIDGFTLASKIRERAELSATPIVLLTSEDRQSDIERLRELRIEAHVLKPVPQDELLSTIYEVMTRSRTPLRGPASDSVRTAAERPAHSSLPLRVLVAEDNAFNSQLLQQLLTSRGHAVRVAHNGREALEYARSGSFDLLLLDLHMPELDGFQVIEALRAHERRIGDGRHLLTIALTARSRDEDRERCFAAGMDDFLAKPIQADALWSAIARITAEPPTARRAASASSLLNPEVLLAACGGSPVILEAVRSGLRARLPLELEGVESALGARDALRLRETAHTLLGLVSAFSTLVAGLASSLEDAAASGDLTDAPELTERLRAIAPRLLEAVEGATIESLRAAVSAQVAPGARN
ncbi:MAG TPA: response regulator [Polyangiaceae bacterium]|nr:response regulator [Polyangiaceae bacterium]